MKAKTNAELVTLRAYRNILKKKRESLRGQIEKYQTTITTLHVETQAIDALLWETSEADEKESNSENTQANNGPR